MLLVVQLRIATPACGMFCEHLFLKGVSGRGSCRRGHMVYALHPCEVAVCVCECVKMAGCSSCSHALHVKTDGITLLLVV